MKGTVNIFNCRGSREMIARPSPPDFYIGRPGPLGNPYSVVIYGRVNCIKKYKLWLKVKLRSKESKQYVELQKMRQSLKDFGIVNLWCWCAPLPCHGDVIKQILLKTR